METSRDAEDADGGEEENAWQGSFCEFWGQVTSTWGKEGGEAVPHLLGGYKTLQRQRYRVAQLGLSSSPCRCCLKGTRSGERRRRGREETPRGFRVCLMPPASAPIGSRLQSQALG